MHRSNLASVDSARHAASSDFCTVAVPTQPFVILQYQPAPSIPLSQSHNLVVVSTSGLCKPSEVEITTTVGANSASGRLHWPCSKKSLLVLLQDESPVVRGRRSQCLHEVVEGRGEKGCTPCRINPTSIVADVCCPISHGCGKGDLIQGVVGGCMREKLKDQESKVIPNSLFERAYCRCYANTLADRIPAVELSINSPTDSLVTRAASQACYQSMKAEAMKLYQEGRYPKQ